MHLYDTEPDKEGKCDYIDVNIPGEGLDKDGWATYKALSGAYKYAITQTFAIPTIDDAERDKYTMNNISDVDRQEDNISTVTKDGSLNETNVEELLGEPSVDDFDKLFDLAG